MPKMHPSRRDFVVRGLCGCALCAASPAALARVLPTQIAPLVSEGYEPKDVDERGLWQACERLEQDLAASNLLISDPALKSYVGSVSERLLGELAADLRIYLVRNAEFNASMFPNGMMIVHTGLLVRMRDEAQLAAVLGHEGGHYLRRHSLQRWREIKTTSAIMAVVALGGAAAAAGSGSYSWYDLANAINTGLLLSVFSFSRELESEADAFGLQLLKRGRYPPKAAAEIWAQVIDERKASAAARKKRYRDHSRSALSTHPPTTDRMQDLTDSAVALERQSVDGDSEDRKAAWLEAIAPMRPSLIEEQVKLNDSGASLYLVNSLATDGWNGVLRFYEGEIYRLRGETGDAALAAQAYAAAVNYPETPAEAYRAHGYAQLKAGNVEEGRQALTRYLEVNPGAVDAEMVRFSLAQ